MLKIRTPKEFGNLFILEIVSLSEMQFKALVVGKEFKPIKMIDPNKRGYVCLKDLVLNITPNDKLMIWEGTQFIFE